jgi:hypothetical protein
VHVLHVAQHVVYLVFICAGAIVAVVLILLIYGFLDRWVCPDDSAESGDDTEKSSGNDLTD